MNRRGFLRGILGLAVACVAGPTVAAFASRMPEVVSEPEANEVFCFGAGPDWSNLGTATPLADLRRLRDESYKESVRFTSEPATWHVSRDMANELRRQGIINL